MDLKKINTVILPLLIFISISLLSGCGGGGGSDGSSGGTSHGIVVSVSAGKAHTCAVNVSGAIKCWGSNSKGQLGNGTYTTSYAPVLVNEMTTATQVSLGYNHSCALLSNGKVKCWGSNSKGQLGNGTVGNSPSPVSVLEIDNAVVIATGYSHSCAVLSSGKIKCWGYNNDGQLGNDSLTDSSVPVYVSGISNATAIAAGYTHSCAVLSTGVVKCWGSNKEGALGNNSTTDSRTPVSVLGGIVSAVSVTAGLWHSCVLKSGGSMSCWGMNDYGELGDGTTTTRYKPSSVLGLSYDEYSANRISTHECHTCASMVNGHVKCWGRNTSGQLGDGSLNNNSIPVTVVGLSDTTMVAAGEDHSCALASGALFCWGKNSNGQLGNGGATDTITPAAVVGF